MNATRLSFDDPKGVAAVIAADRSPSYWQPEPANGFAEVLLSPRNIRSVQPFSVGTQLLPPGGKVRLHSHDSSEEVLYVLQGQGAAEVDGKAERMAPGTVLYLGHNCTHTFTNDGDTDLKWVWFFMPGGLEDFFAAIGRERQPADTAPAPFARPADVKEIEANTVFAR